jgi:hypothetical protein
MVLFRIKEPIWKDRSVGLALDKIPLHDDLVKVEILYKDKQGKFIYPHPLYISSLKALRYKYQIVKGTKLVIIPIKDMVVNESKMVI